MLGILRNHSASWHGRDTHAKELPGIGDPMFPQSTRFYLRCGLQENPLGRRCAERWEWTLGRPTGEQLPVLGSKGGTAVIGSSYTVPLKTGVFHLPSLAETDLASELSTAALRPVCGGNGYEAHGCRGTA